MVSGRWGCPSARTSERRYGSGRVATPELFTPMLCAVQRLPFRKVAANSRSSSASSVFVLPVWGAANGKAVDGTVMRMLEEMLGVPPGVATRRSTNSPKNALLTPMKDPSVALGSTLSTPCGVNGPSPVPRAMVPEHRHNDGAACQHRGLADDVPVRPLEGPVPENTLVPMYRRSRRSPACRSRRSRRWHASATVESLGMSKNVKLDALAMVLPLLTAMRIRLFVPLTSIMVMNQRPDSRS
jgi:hypothetical protein